MAHTPKHAKVSGARGSTCPPDLSLERYSEPLIKMDVLVHNCSIFYAQLQMETAVSRQKQTTLWSWRAVVVLLLFHEESVCLRSEVCRTPSGHFDATKAKEDQPSIPLPWPFSFSISFLWSRSVGIHLTQHCLSKVPFTRGLEWLRDSPDLADASLCGFVMFCLKRGGYLDCTRLQF